MRVNHTYLCVFTLVFMMAGSLQGGWVLSESGQVGYVLNVKLGWNAREGDFMNMYNWVIIIGVFGLAIGSVFGRTIANRFGLYNTLIGTLVLSIVFNTVKCIEYTPCILIGRFCFGLINGVATFCQSKALNDTVPPAYTNIYIGSVNMGFVIGRFISNFFATLLPLDETGINLDL